MKPVIIALILASSLLAADGPLAAARITAGTTNDQLLYFTSSSLLADDRRLVFISDRTGHPNLFTRDLVSGEERQLTRNADGYLRSYVYFDGNPYRGFGKASVSLDVQRGIAYYIQGREIRAVDMAGVERVLATCPDGQVTAFTHVSADGRRLCVPTTDAAAFDGPPAKTDARVQEGKLSSYLRILDTASGAEIACERVPCAWITHVQFSPVDPDLILYNHEWPSDCGIRRMWLWNGKTHLRLRGEGDGRRRDDWACHEMWERDGSAIIYHGAFHQGPAFLGRVQPDGSGRVEIALDKDWHRYGHFTVGRPGRLVSDGYFQAPDDPKGGSGAWISVLDVDWTAARITWKPLVRHGSSWKGQDVHPHPIFDHQAAAVWFTSDRDGRRAVWRMPVERGDP